MLSIFKGAPAPIVFIVLSFLCPTELSLFVGGLRMPPHRVALLLLLPIAVYRLATRRDIRIRSFDILLGLFAAWLVAVYSQHSGQEGFIYGGSLALESFGGYIVARAWIRDPATFYASLRVLIAAIVSAALIALPESLLKQNFAHDLLYGLTGYMHPTGIETRLGLARAYSTFDHPIHYATFCAALFALFWFAERRASSRRSRAAILGGATLLGVSSAPLLCLALQVALLVWERVTRGIAGRTAMTLTALSGLYLGALLVSDRGPIAIIATGLTFDSWTGFYRLQIWTHGIENVLSSPWTGIGLAEWDRPAWMVSSTVDAFWLVTAMRSGLPSILLIGLAIGLLGRAVVKRGINSRDFVLRRLATGWMMSLIALCLVGCTVHFWNVLHTYFFFFLGLAGWIADPKRSVKQPTLVMRRRWQEPARRMPFPGPRPVYGGALAAGVAAR